jgi:hypothetical protein
MYHFIIFVFFLEDLWATIHGAHPIKDTNKTNTRKASKPSMVLLKSQKGLEDTDE